MGKKTAIIIGGGPAGLTAAYEFLKHTDIHPVVIEKSDYWGGISRTVNYKNNRIDIGGHRFFSKSNEVMQWWSEILPVYTDDLSAKIIFRNKPVMVHADENIAGDDKVMLVRKRKSSILFQKKFIGYPVALTFDTIRKIGIMRIFPIGFSYLKARLFPVKNELTLEDFFINRFGKYLYRIFFKDYTEKVWGVKCSEISAKWGAQRIKGLSAGKSVGHSLRKLFWRKKDIEQKKTETSLIEYFLYPKYGPGQMWEEVASKIAALGGTLMQDSEVIKINIEQNSVKSITVKDIRNGTTTKITGDYFISSMPITELVESLDCPVPEDVLQVAKGLRYRAFITVGLLLKKMKVKIDDNWIYVQEPYVKVGRLQVFNNWSPYMINDKSTIWTGLEYFCNEEDDLWKMDEQAITALAVDEMTKMGLMDKDDLLDSVVIKMPKAYPAYYGTYPRISAVTDYLDGIPNLFLVGRNGMHKYNNQDHSMLTAMQAVYNIKNNISSKQNIWAINTEQKYLEEE